MPNVITNRKVADQYVREYFQGRQTRKEFCTEHNINIGTFQWWIQRYRKNNDSEKSLQENAPFVRISPVNKKGYAASGLESELIIEFDNGTRIKWRGHEVPPSICELISILPGVTE